MVVIRRATYFDDRKEERRVKSGMELNRRSKTHIMSNSTTNDDDVVVV